MQEEHLKEEKNLKLKKKSSTLFHIGMNKCKVFVLSFSKVK